MSALQAVVIVFIVATGIVAAAEFFVIIPETMKWLIEESKKPFVPEEVERKLLE